MSNRNKLSKFADLLTFGNVYQSFDPKDAALQWHHGQIVHRKGSWAKDHFLNSNPIVLELACGRGEYSLGLGRMHPGKNFIGLDIKGARIWKGARIALQEDLSNIAFLRTRIEFLEQFFGSGEVSEIWIIFPDPFLKKSKSNRRLTAPRFLDIYKRLLDAQGTIHLKTDSPALYDFTLKTLATYPGAQIQYACDDIYSNPLPFEELAIKTYYEEMHLKDQRTIKYIRFKIH